MQDLDQILEWHAPKFQLAKQPPIGICIKRATIVTFYQRGGVEAQYNISYELKDN
jgi:hypothetical protein